MTHDDIQILRVQMEKTKKEREEEVGMFFRADGIGAGIGGYQIQMALDGIYRKQGLCESTRGSSGIQRLLEGASVSLGHGCGLCSWATDCRT